jgi:predicted short-subunit dehydrogenase-like oxidoreductase (DUF2520 family)
MQQPLSPPPPESRPQRILVVGAGPVGHVLADSLGRAGFPLRHWARSRGPLWEETATRQAVDIVILAVRDEAIASAARFIVEHQAADQRTVLLHCAGAVPPLVAFAEEVGRVRGCGLLHPLRSFVEGSAVDERPAGSPGGGPLAPLGGTVMAIGGDDPGLETARLLCDALGGVALPVSAEQQAAYHAAAVMAAGHVAALLDVAAHILARIGLHRPDAERALSALTRSVTRNIDDVGLPAALTGPFARGDAEVIASHLRALSALSAEAEAVYRALCPSAIDLAYRKGAAPPEALDRIADLVYKNRRPAPTQE